MKIRVEYTETIQRVAYIEAVSTDDVRQRLTDGDDELIEEIEAVSVEVDGGGLTYDAIEYTLGLEEVA